MDIPLDVEVFCADGACGRSIAVIVDPKTEQVTHFVARSDGSEYLVPIAAVAESSPTRIQLRWNREKLAQAESFLKKMPADEAQLAILAAEAMTPSMLTPYTAADAAFIAGTLAVTLRDEQVPQNELALHRGARVEATDGGVGQVDEFLIDQPTGRISHLVLRRGHLWGKRDVTIPVDHIDRIEGEVIHLKLDKAAVERLPGVPAARK